MPARKDSGLCSFLSPAILSEHFTFSRSGAGREAEHLCDGCCCTGLTSHHHLQSPARHSRSHKATICHRRQQRRLVCIIWPISSPQSEPGKLGRACQRESKAHALALLLLLLACCAGASAGFPCVVWPGLCSHCRCRPHDFHLLQSRTFTIYTLKTAGQPASLPRARELQPERLERVASAGESLERVSAQETNIRLF